MKTAIGSTNKGQQTDAAQDKHMTRYVPSRTLSLLPLYARKVCDAEARQTIAIMTEIQ
jgi:hypothetical protein